MIVALVQKKDKQPRWIIKLDFCILDRPSSITFSGGMQPVCLPVKQLIPWKLNDFVNLAWNVQLNICILGRWSKKNVPFSSLLLLRGDVKNY